MKRDLSTIDRDIGQDWSRIIQEAFAHGILNEMIYGGLEVGQTALQGLYVAQTTKNCAYGTRRVKWDGRVFRYARCGTTFTSTTMGVHNDTILVSNRVTGGTAWAAAPAITAAGAIKVTVTFDAGELGDSTSKSDAERTGVIAENELVGGYVHFQTIPIADTEYDQNRLIIGNTAVGVGDTSMILYLDEPLNYELKTAATASTCEILASPYANVRRSNDEFVSVVGVPNVPATALQFLWLQTWGPMRISPTTDTPAANARQYVFDDFGTVIPAAPNGVTESYQHAGFLIEKTAAIAYYHSPFIMLQISP